MREVKQKYGYVSDLTKKAQNKLKLEELFVDFNERKIAVSDLFVKFTDKDGILKLRPIRSKEDFVENTMNGLVVADKKAEEVLSDKHVTLYYKNIPEFKTYESTSYNSINDEKIPYGLKRILSVKEATGNEEEKYFYVKNAGKWELLRKDEILWFDGVKMKPYTELPENAKVENLKFFDLKNQEITECYTNEEYIFDKVIAKEEVDFVKQEKKTYSISKGKLEYQTTKLDPFISEQEFVKVEEPVLNSSKIKQVSKRKVRNFQAVAQDQIGKYIALTVDGNIKMFELDKLFDEDGRKVNDLSLMVGKRVKVKDDNKFIATSEPLTYEQANRTYDTIKNYQETEELSDSSLLRLDDGTYVNEKQSIQPKSFKDVDDSTESKDFDKYLVEQNKGSESKFVIVDKNYFEKHGKSSGFNTSKAVKLKRCDFKDKDCSVVQTLPQQETKDKSVHDCAIVGEIKIGEETLISKDKDTQYKLFLEEYKSGEHKIDDVFVGEELRKIETPGMRYELTDVTYLHDKADDLIQYRALNTSDLTFKDGKVKGSQKYDVWEGIKASYDKWWKTLSVSVVGMGATGIFLPLTLPAITVASVGLLAAAPLIPIVNIGIGIIKNGVIGKIFRKIGKYKDKTEYDRKIDVKEINKEIKLLYEKSSDLTQTQFNDCFKNRIISRIIALSATTSNNSLEIENGEAKVNSNNVNLALDHSAEYLKTSKDVRIFETLVASAKNKLDRLEKRIAKLKKVGKNIPEKLQQEYNNAKTEFENKQDLLNERKAKKEHMLNATFGESYEINAERNNLLNKAVGLKTYMYLSKYNNKEIIGDLTKEEIKRLSFDLKKGLLLDGKQVFNTDKKIEKQSKTWKTLRGKLLTVVEKVQSEVDVNVEPNKDDVKTEEVNNNNTLDENLKNAESELVQATNDLQEEVEELENQKTEFENQLKDLETKLIETLTDEERTVLENFMSKIEEEIDNLENGKKKLQEKVVELEKIKKDQETTIMDSADKILALAYENKNLKILNKTLKSFEIQYERSQKEHEKIQYQQASVELELNEKLNSKDEEIEKFKEQIQIRDNRIEQLNQRLIAAEYQTGIYAEENDKTKQEIAKLKEEQEQINKDLENTLIDNKEEIQALKLIKNELEIKSRNMQKVLGLQAEQINNAKAKIESLELEKEKLNSLNETLHEYEVKLKETQEKLDNLENAKTQAEDKLKTDLKLKQKEVDDLNKEILDYVAEKSVLVINLASAKIEIDNISRQIKEISSQTKGSTELENENKTFKERILGLDGIVKRYSNSISTIDKLVDDLNVKIKSIDTEIKAKVKERETLLNRINNNEEAKTINKDLQAYRKTLRNINAKIESIQSELLLCKQKSEEFKEIWDAGLTEEGNITKIENLQRISKINDLLERTKKQQEEVNVLTISNVKEKEEYNVSINSENNLKELLIERDVELINYLQEQGIVCSESDIEETISRIESKHKENKIATAHSSTLKNKSISQILTQGQAYITDVLSKGIEI